MKIFHKFILSCLTAAATLFAAGCSESEVDSASGGSYGNVQFRLVKQTRAEQLDYLNDAYKVKVLLAQDDEQVNLSLLVNRAASDEIAEFGMNTEIGQLRVGSYDLQEYTVYNETDEVLLYGEPDEAISFEIIAGGLTRPELPLSTQPRGKISFKFTKDFINYTRAGEHRDTYLFSEIARATVTLKNLATSQTRRFTDVECTYQADFWEEDPSGEQPLQGYTISNDAYPIEAGEWVLTTLELQDADEDILEYLYDLDAQEHPAVFTVEDNAQTEAVVPVQVDCTQPHIRDYIALKKIWDKMDGEKWSWRGDSYYPVGANWDFNRDIDMWGIQPGVGLYANGRVSQLNLGGFSPSGAVPEELGELTELNSLFIGTHSDAMDSSMRPEYPGPTEYGPVTHQSHYTGYREEFDPWARIMKDENLSESRMERAAAEFRARHAEPENEVFGRVEALKKGQTWKRNDATPYASVDYGIIMNRITSLPESIGNLKKLEYLYIANSTIGELPDALSQLESVTDLEIYNCPAMRKFPREIATMKNLISVNIGQNYQWDPEDMRQGLTELFDGPSREKIQILYIDHCRLRTFPSNASNAKALGLLEATGCGLEEFPVPMGRDVRIVYLYLDYNNLTTLPDEFIGIDSFEEISIAHNRLETFPSFFAGGEGFIGGEVSVEGNRITSMGPDFKGILCQTLNLSYNRFTDLPKEFGPTESYVMQLNIAANQLDSLRGESLKGLPHTQVLDLSMNRLSKLPNIPLGSYMPYLTGVNVSNNCFSSWPTFFFNGYGIMTFLISDQRDPETAEKCLTQWPEGMEVYYPGLKQLDISGNDIRSINSFPTTLYYLDIADNPNVSLAIPETICSAIVNGTFTFIYDQDQTGITGCAALGIGE